MSIELIRRSGQTIQPIKDIRLFTKIFAEACVLEGCELTYLGTNQIRISAGTMLVCGGDISIAQEDISVELAESGTLPGRLYVHIDLSDTENPVSFSSVASDPLPALVQNSELYEENGIYDMELATYTAGTVAITDLVTTYRNFKNMSYEIIGGPIYGKLTAGQTTLTINDDRIVVDGTARYVPYVESGSDMELTYKTWTADTGVMVFTFTAQAQDIYVYVHKSEV